VEQLQVAEGTVLNNYPLLSNDWTEQDRLRFFQEWMEKDMPDDSMTNTGSDRGGGQGSGGGRSDNPLESLLRRNRRPMGDSDDGGGGGGGGLPIPFWRGRRHFGRGFGRGGGRGGGRGRR
jgi:hypothetical protein